jgi:hypothetical protein
MDNVKRKALERILESMTVEELRKYPPFNGEGVDPCIPDPANPSKPDMIRAILDHNSKMVNQLLRPTRPT